MVLLGRMWRWFYERPYLILTITALSWGGNAVVGRLAVGEVSPMAIVCLRWLIVVAILTAAMRRPLAAEWRLLLPHWPRLFLMGALGYTLFNAIFYWAAHYTSAVNIGVLQGITPALVMAGSFVAYGTSIGRRQVLGLVLTLLGVLVTASHGDLEVLRHLELNIGDIGIVLASILYAGYTVALRNRPRIGPIVFFAAMAFSAFVTSVPLLAWEVATGTVLWPTPLGWAIIVFIAVMPSLTSQLLYMRGVELIGPSRAGLFMNLIPVFAACLAVLLLGETFAPYHAAALALVLGGIWLAERRGVSEEDAGTP